MKKTLKYSIGTLALAMMLTLSVSAANTRPDRGDVMDATPDVYNAGWVTGVSADGGAKGQSIALGDNSTDASDFAYYSFRNWWGQELSDVTKIRASFMAAEGTVNSGGSPRISLEVDLNGDGDVTGDYTVIYLDPAHCGNLSASGWTNSDFTGDVTDCAIYTSLSATPYTSDGVTSAWDMLVADPIFADAEVWFAYAIQDATTGTNYIDRIMLDSAFITKQP